MASLRYQILAGVVLSWILVAVAQVQNRGLSVVDYTWGNWTQCSKTCGDEGLQKRMTCADDGTCEAEEAWCNRFACVDPFSDNDWSECSASCDGGTRSRWDNLGVNMQEISCNMHSCLPVIGDCRADIVFILDSSASIGNQNWYVVKQFVMDLIRGLKISYNQTRVGVVSFSTMTVTNFHLQEFFDVNIMAEDIWEMTFLAGSTNTADGILYMRQMMAQYRRPDVQQISVVLTDGVSNIDASRTIPEANQAKSEDIEMFVIGVGMVDTEEVIKITSDPRWFFNVTDFQALASLTEVIINETCATSGLVQCKVCEYSACSESCGAQGTQQGYKECKRYERFTWTLMDTYDVSCPPKECFIPCPTTTTTEPTTTTSEPTTTTSEPTTTTSEPTTTTSEPTTTTSEPTTTTSEPTTTTSEPTTTTTEPTTTTTPVPTRPPPVDCHLCDFTKGQIWRPDPDNCHRFYVCEPLDDADGDGVSDVSEYRIHHMTCDDMYWNQDIHTCVREKPADAICIDDTPVPWVGTSAGPIACPYEPKADDAQYFRGANDSDEAYQKCSDGMIFVADDLCTCMEQPQALPTCADDLLLHFTYEDHFNDVTCHHAIATKYGSGNATLEVNAGHSAVRFDGSSYFEVPFIRTFFAGATIGEFSVSLWFYQDSSPSAKAVLVSNGDCDRSPAFEIAAKSAGAVAECGTTSASLPLGPVTISNGQWNHAAWVYDGSQLRFYLNGQEEANGAIQGPLSNPDAPMGIGALCGEEFFSGLLDEIRVYTRALSLVEVQNFANQSFP